MEKNIIHTLLPLPYPSKYAGKHNSSLVPESKLIEIVIGAAPDRSKKGGNSTEEDDKRVTFSGGA